MIDSVPLIQNANDAQQINASIIAMKKASKELDEKILKLNNLNKELDKKIAVLDNGLAQEITDRENAINALDVAGVGGSGKYISAISETDGKISATASDLATTVSSGNSQPVTSGGVADTLNNPLIKTFTNFASSDKIIHLGHFTIPSVFTNRCGLNIEVEAKRADGSYRILGSIIGEVIKIGVYDASDYIDLLFYKTDNNNFDLYLFIGNWIEQVFVRMTEPLYFTYDGSVVTSYAGTKVSPIYSNSTDIVISGIMQPVTSNAVATTLGTWETLWSSGYSIIKGIVCNGKAFIVIHLQSFVCSSDFYAVTTVAEKYRPLTVSRGYCFEDTHPITMGFINVESNGTIYIVGMNGKTVYGDSFIMIEKDV